LVRTKRGEGTTKTLRSNLLGGERGGVKSHHTQIGDNREKGK